MKRRSSSNFCYVIEIIFSIMSLPDDSNGWSREAAKLFDVGKQFLLIKVVNRDQVFRLLNRLIYIDGKAFELFFCTTLLLEKSLMGRKAGFLVGEAEGFSEVAAPMMRFFFGFFIS